MHISAGIKTSEISVLGVNFLTVVKASITSGSNRDGLQQTTTFLCLMKEVRLSLREAHSSHPLWVMAITTVLFISRT